VTTLNPRQGRGLALLAAFSLFALSRAYQGVQHDGRLYVADALAKLDPGGIGRDLMFVHDGQFGFSLYTPLLSRLIAALGLSNAALAIVALTLCLWFAALVALTDRLAADRPPAVRWAMLVFAAALPAFYGPMNVISFGEPFAVPRGLAEAAGMAGMAAYLSNRRVLSFGLYALAMAFHPIMGLCGLAAVYLALCLEDRRWIALGVVGVVAVLLAAVLKLPVADRLLVVMDPQWRALVEARSPILFTTLWPLQTWTRLAVQMTTLAVGVILLEGRARKLALGALAAGGLGVVLVAVLGDGLSLVLVLQLQTWRMLQPMALLAAACLALAVVALPKRGPGGMIALAALVWGWLFIDWGPVGFIASGVALAALALDGRTRWSNPALISKAGLALIGFVLALYAFTHGMGLAGSLEALPSAWPFSWALVWNSGLPGALVMAVVGVWIANGWAAPKPILALVATLVLAGLAAGLWDDRSDSVKFRDRGPDPALRAIIASRPGEVLWLAGDMEPWVLAGRPSWASKVQGAGVVFSRPLAAALKARTDRIFATGLVGRDWLEPLTAADSRPGVPTPARLADLCAASDAPAWIVWPRSDGARLDPALRAVDWTPGAPYALELRGPNGADWLTAERYAVIPCAGD
jgi:hypothetical protein